MSNDDEYTEPIHPSRPLYLHETVDIVGEGAVPYMEESVVGFDAEGIADRGLTLYGTWYVQGSTGRWPQVVNVWELVDGWTGWQRLCEATNLKREANTGLSDWWKQAYERRSGGFDRLMGALPGALTLDEIRAQQIRGELFVHEMTEVQPGAGPEYIRELMKRWAPVRAEYGHRLVGAFENLMSDTEVCTIWATTLHSHVTLGRAMDDARGFGTADHPDERLVSWVRYRRNWCTRFREELMIPCPGTPMGPSEWRAA